MKIIKAGKKKPQRFRGTCQFCGCVVEVENGESCIKYDTDPRESHQPYVKCPQCKTDFLWLK